MNAELIYPMAAMVLLTALVLVRMVQCRVSAVEEGRSRPIVLQDLSGRKG